jgi:hypothetical protein
MAQTFEIRFARSAGLAAILEAPSNSFHWTGNGSLSIDAQGISVAVRRGLLSLLGVDRMRRIPASDLKEVFREGEALRVEFAANDTARGSLRFWATDRDTAARIVRLLPTSRTVELEESAALGEFRVNRRIALILGLVLAVVAGTIIAISLRDPRQTSDQRLTTSEQPASLEPAPLPDLATPALKNTDGTPSSDTPGARAPRAAIVPASSAPAGTVDPSGTTSATRQATPDTPAGATSSATSTSDGTTAATEAGVAPADSKLALLDAPTFAPPPLAPPAPASTHPIVTPIPHGTPSFNRALRQLALFGSESDDLLAEYDAYLNRFRNGQIGVGEFTKRLSELEKLWLNVTSRIQEAQDFADPLLVDLRATLLACAGERRSFLSSFSRGTATADQQSIKSAAEHEARAVELDQRARRYID